MNLLALLELRETLRYAYMNGMLTAKTYTLAAGEIGTKITELSSLTR
jgi:hypothetical protein